jgi:hypothetical protein
MRSTTRWSIERKRRSLRNSSGQTSGERTSPHSGFGASRCPSREAGACELTWGYLRQSRTFGTMASAFVSTFPFPTTPIGRNDRHSSDTRTCEFAKKWRRAKGRPESRKARPSKSPAKCPCKSPRPASTRRAPSLTTRGAAASTMRPGMDPVGPPMGCDTGRNPRLHGSPNSLGRRHRSRGNA